SMSTVALDVDAARARFSALRQPLVFLDAPGGTQVPDQVIAAIADYLRESNANVSGPYETSRRTEALVEQARETAGRFLGCSPGEAIFGANMTTLNFRSERERQRTVRDEPPDRGARRAGARDRRPVPRVLPRRGDLRGEHDDAQLPI